MLTALLALAGAPRRGRLVRRRRCPVSGGVATAYYPARLGLQIRECFLRFSAEIFGSNRNLEPAGLQAKAAPIYTGIFAESLQ